MNRTSIEFCDFSWNVIVGCRNGCEYCWARKFNDRYFKNNNFNVPRFYPERLNDRIPKLPKERNYIAQAISPDRPVVFVVDMGDIFSKGVQETWIGRIFEYIEDHYNANFLLLTKRPEIYSLIDIPIKNTFIGTSLDFAHNYKRVNYVMQMGIMGYKTFVNIEPLMSQMDQVDFSGIDFIVVGALTGKKYNPNPAWHQSIRHNEIFYKRNYTAYFPELMK